MKLCDWCEQPTEDDKELCVKCLAAQSRVSSGNALLPEKSAAESWSMAIGIRNTLILSSKIVLSAILSVFAVLFGFTGTCTALSLSHGVPGNAMDILVWIVLPWVLAILCGLMLKRLGDMAKNDALKPADNKGLLTHGEISDRTGDK